jgi:predicted metal-binding protein
MIEVGSYCCSFVERPLPSSNTNPACVGAFRFLGLGIGVMNLALRRVSVIFCVGCPSHRVPNAGGGSHKESSESGGQRMG